MPSMMFGNRQPTREYQRISASISVTRFARYAVVTAASSACSAVSGCAEFKIDGRAVAPESFEPVEFARFLVHDMNHEITVVKQHPLALGQALARSAAGGRST